MELIDYRCFLKLEMAERKRGRSTYSLRAFARDAKISPAFLSQLFSCQKSLSVEKALAVGAALKWDQKKVEFFSSLVQFQNNPSAHPVLRRPLERAQKRYRRFHNVKEEQFRLISEWFHYALLELTEVKGFSENPHWIAKRLGITPARARDALLRLQGLGLLETREGQLRKAQMDYKIKSISSEAIRSFHRQNLRRAEMALERQHLAEREFYGATMAVDPKHLPEAKRRIAQFTAELMQLLESGERKVVYHFATQLFRAEEA